MRRILLAVGVLAASAVALLAGCTAPAPVPDVAPVTTVATAPTTGGDAVTASPPVRIRLATLGVDVPVVQVGVDAQGGMEVPEDVRTVGWYRFGAAPGAATGSAVLSGHVDDRIQGPGAFFDLADLAVGDDVQVRLADGTALDYRVSDVERIDKSVLPVDRLFDRDGRPVLTLVTCGGSFDRATRNYRQNVVVTARPVG